MFLRTDLGMFHAVLRDSGQWKMTEKGLGLGLVSGAGYSWSWARGKILLEAKITSRSFFKENDRYSHYGLSLGFIGQVAPVHPPNPTGDS